MTTHIISKTDLVPYAYSDDAPLPCPPLHINLGMMDLSRRLPAEYRQLEARVDALQGVHQKLLKVSKVHESESVSYRIPVPNSTANG